MENSSAKRLIEAVFLNKSSIRVHDIMEIVEMAAILPENIILEVEMG